MRSIAHLEYARLKSRSHVSGLCARPFMVIVAHRAAFAGLPPAVAHRQHFREKHTTCPFAPLRGHYLVRTISGVRMLGCAIRFRCKPLEAGMMTPRRLSAVPAPLWRLVILATGVIGLLAAFGPAGIRNTGAP